MPVRSSVVVVSYRPGDWLRACLESVMGHADEVIVVDNGSEGSAASEVARSAGATVVRSAVNRGFTGGANAGLSVARGEVVGLLNDDAVAGAGWLPAAAAALATEAGVAVVTPKVLFATLYAEVVLDPPARRRSDDGPATVRSITAAGREVLAGVLGPGVTDDGPAGGGSARRVISSTPFYVPVRDPADCVLVDGAEAPAGPVVRVFNHAGSFLLPHGISGEYGLGAPDDGRFDTRAERFGFSGTAPVFSAEALRRVGGFAGPFFAYNEDTDWCARARLAGLRILYDPAGVVLHRGSATSGGVASSRVRYLAQRNALLCLLRDAPREAVAAYAYPRLRRGGRDDEVRRDVLRMLPWALATRALIGRHRSIRRHAMWDTWAGRDTTWDQSPARPAP